MQNKLTLPETLVGSALRGKIILVQKEPKQRYQTTKEHDTFRAINIIINSITVVTLLSYKRL